MLIEGNLPMLGGNVLTRRNYHTLDGLRGVAALSIVILHTPHFLGWWNLPSSFLSVDLFFVLSGFVLSHAYEHRFQSGLSVFGFLWIRLIRLYPLYILGTALGIPVALLALKFGGGGLTVPWTPKLFVTSLPLSIMMLPTPTSNIAGSDAIYPFNPVLWSIFFELFINVIYVYFWRYFKDTRVLLLVICISAALLVGYGIASGDLDSGFGWSNILGGFVRVFFSFFCGVFIFRMVNKYKVKTSVSFIAPVCILIILMVFSLPKNVYFEILSILFLFPAIVAISSTVEPRKFLKLTFSFIGVASYAVYTIHKPLYQLLLGLMKVVLPFPPEQLAPWIGIAYIPCLLCLCIVVDRTYDAPLRRALGKFARAVKQNSQPGPEQNARAPAA